MATRGRGGTIEPRGLIVASSGAHSSVQLAGQAMDVDVVRGPGRRRGRMHGRALRETIADARRRGRRADVRRSSPRGHHQRRRRRRPRRAPRLSPTRRTSGSTSTGPTAARRSPPRACEAGSTASSAPTASSSTRTSGCSRRSTAVHCSTATPSRPGRAHAAGRVPRRAAETATSWNPSDYAHHLSRRVRGLPLWFSLATYGTDAYRDAVETTLDGRPRRRRR